MVTEMNTDTYSSSAPSQLIVVSASRGAVRLLACAKWFGIFGAPKKKKRICMQIWSEMHTPIANLGTYLTEACRSLFAGTLPSKSRARGRLQLDDWYLCDFHSESSSSEDFL